MQVNAENAYPFLLVYAAASFAAFGAIVVWAGLHPALAYAASVLGFALFVALVMSITQPPATVRLQ